MCGKYVSVTEPPREGTTGSVWVGSWVYKVLYMNPRPDSGTGWYILFSIVLIVQLGRRMSFYNCARAYRAGPEEFMNLHGLLV